ncbi:hypothetical protein ES705_11735 [subsurface metagenome]
MRLIKLKVAGLRGFNEEQEIDLDGRLVIYSGINGSGKSSIAEAIEWVLFGCTLRRIKGDSISKREYANSYRNVHYKGPKLPFVELTFRDASNQEHTILRELNEDESTNLFVDSKHASDLSSVGITNLRDRPLILQHALHDFIFMRPKERYEVLSAMLGLEELITFRACIEDTRNNLIQNYPKSIKETVYRAKLAISEFEQVPITKTIVDLLNKNEIDAAYEQLFAIASSRVPAIEKGQNVIDTLKAELALKQRSHLDWGRFSYSTSPVTPSHPFLNDMPILNRQVENFNEKIGKLVLEIAKSKEKEKDDSYKEFLRLGLNFLERNKKTCPFCLAESLTSERIEQIKQVCVESNVAQSQLQEVLEAIRIFKNSVTSHWERIAGLIPKFPDQDKKEKIRQLLSKESGREPKFIDELDSVSGTIQNVTARKEELVKTIESCETMLSTKPGRDRQFPDIGKCLKEYHDEITLLAKNLNAYGDIYSQIDPVIRKFLSTTSEISLLSLLIEAFEKWNDIKMLKYLDDLQEKLLDLIRIGRKYIEERQIDILGERDKQIKDWYDVMNPGAGVGYDSILPRTDALDLQGRTFGHLMMAAPNLSNVQLNCVGLAITLACTTRAESVYRFIVIDDPIQSMDDEHTETFKKSVIKKLLDSGFQVILLSQLQKFAEGVEALYRQSYDDICLYNIRSYQINGPIIEGGGPGIMQLLNDIKKNKDALNLEYRKAATQDLRKFVERFTKDLYTAETKNPISKRYRNVSWPRLKNLLRQCKMFHSSDEAILEDAHNFTAQFLHDDGTIGKTVPSPSQLKPHYDAMHQIFTKYKKVLGI